MQRAGGVFDLNPDVRHVVYGKLRVRASSNAAARRSLMSSIEEQYAPLGQVGDLSPDSSFLALAREFMDHVEFTQEQRDTTRHENRRLIEKKIAPHMGALAIREIKASTVLRVYNAIHNETPSTARNVKALISQICSYAVMNDLMVANPAREVKQVRQQSKPIYAPAPMELEDLRGIIRDYQNRTDRMGPRPSDLLGDVVDLILATGARIGEAVGLKWEYVDMDSPKPTITIAGKVVDSKGQPKHWENYLKSESGWRRITVPPELLPMLRRRKLTSGGNRRRRLYRPPSWCAQAGDQIQADGKKLSRLDVDGWSEMTDLIRAGADCVIQYSSKPLGPSTQGRPRLR